MKIVLKLGGATLEDSSLLPRAALVVKNLAVEHQVAVVHGGGTALTRVLQQIGKRSEFIGGLRVTDHETRDFAVMVLAGYVNKKLVASLACAGQPAMGLCGSDGQTFRAVKKSANGHDLGFVGEISSVDPSWIHRIWQQGAVPVISSVAMGDDGEYYNINADQVAAVCAAACHANALIFLTDVAGVKDANGLVIPQLTLNHADELTKKSIISGGMLPKLEACKQALLSGVYRVHILPASEVEALLQFCFNLVKAGTEVLAARTCVLPSS